MLPSARTRGVRSVVVLVLAAICGLVGLSEIAWAGEQAAFPTADLSKAKPSVFDVHVNNLSDEGVPRLRPWRTIEIDPEYCGAWIVAGDLTGDGVAEIVSAKNGTLARDTHYTASVVVHRLDGSVLWKWGNPAAKNRLHHDVACQIYDLDGDGRNEVVVAADCRVVVLEGTTGKVRREFEIPRGASDCITFCNLSGNRRATDMLVKTRYTQLWAYNSQGEPLWTVAKPGGCRTSHQPFPIDLDGDGRDEVIAGYAALNHDGTERWRLPDELRRRGGHADSIRLFRDGPRPEDKRILLTHCGGNCLDMLDGAGAVKWTATGLHFESVFFGELDADVPGQEIVVDICHTPWGQSPLVILDQRGRLLGRYMTMRSRCHRLIDWFGEGQDLIAAGQTRALLDAHGHKRALLETPPSPGAAASDTQGRYCYLVHLADITGNGRPDLLLSTVPGSVVWIYRNDNGAKNLSRNRQTMPVNATLY
ncbi:MAG: hypothetical protein JW818_12920 [Pirellulales bacterium]|nr:hypothetical protein [Pirellulales bacterium]